ncbi:MAG: Nif3-like dinuclear metal center hexameric protein [bacterium]
MDNSSEMNVADIENIIDQWSPSWTAWERDNSGLQIGNRSRRVTRILLALDVSESIIKEAISKNVQLIITHHPLFFRHPAAITSANSTGRLALLLAEHKIALLAVHTNLDFTKNGVSFSLAKTLGLTKIQFLTPLKETLAKIVVFAPEDHVETVANAMATCGAGLIGNYSSCSFRTNGVGTFLGSDESNPHLGQSNQLEQVHEIRLEMIAPRARVGNIIAAMKSVHPYEEVAYDIYPLDNPNPNYGMGAIGELQKSIGLTDFLSRAKRALQAEGVRYSGNLQQQIRSIAVCGGSGSELLEDAIRARADIFLTADIKYHTFQAADQRIALVDSGHWETERIILPVLAKHLRRAFQQSRVSIQLMITKKITNPIHYY